MIREPWDQRLDERDDHYRMFVWWRDQIPRPEPSDSVLAWQYDWSNRAAAWDAHQSIPTRIEDQIEASVRALAEVTILESRRLLDRVRVEGGPTLSIKELSTLQKNIVQIQGILLESLQRQQALGAGGEVSEAHALTEGLSDAEEQLLLKLLEKGAKQ